VVFLWTPLEAADQTGTKDVEVPVGAVVAGKLVAVVVPAALPAAVCVAVVEYFEAGLADFELVGYLGG
jgi:hypothetical protein